MESGDATNKREILGVILTVAAAVRVKVAVRVSVQVGVGAGVQVKIVIVFKIVAKNTIKTLVFATTAGAGQEVEAGIKSMKQERTKIALNTESNLTKSAELYCNQMKLKIDPKIRK